MNLQLLPQPQNVVQKNGSYALPGNVVICIGPGFAPDVFARAVVLKEEITHSCGLTCVITKTTEPFGDIYIRQRQYEKQRYSLDISEKGVSIGAVDETGILYGIQTLRQILRQYRGNLPHMQIDDAPVFKTRGFYHDVSRGKIPKLETLMELADMASFYKLNQLQLYIEHTFAYGGHSEIWAGGEPLTAEDILRLDAYCRQRFVELVPSISVFGHLYHALRSKTFGHLRELEDEDTPFCWHHRMAHHTLDVSNEESFSFSKDMLDQVFPLFSSNKFNICADETFDLGEGKTKELAQRLGKGTLYTTYLLKLLNHVKAQGKEVMFWGDILLHHPEEMAKLPEDVICLNWDYAATVPEEKIKIFAENGIHQYVCPGVSGWNRLVNDMDTAFSNIHAMARLGKEYGALGLLNTDWGDYGHTSLYANILPGLALGGSLSWNPDSYEHDAAFDKALSVVGYGETGGALVGTIRELSRCELGSWVTLALWYDSTANQLEEELYQLHKRNAEEHTAAEYLDAANKSRKIIGKLIDFSGKVAGGKQTDMQEFIIAAEGVELLDLVVPALIELDGYAAPVPLGDMAVALEHWLDKFCQAWRKRNRESELGRIRNVIQYVCGYLRKRG